MYKKVFAKHSFVRSVNQCFWKMVAKKYFPKEFLFIDSFINGTRLDVTDLKCMYSTDVFLKYKIIL